MGVCSVRSEPPEHVPALERARFEVYREGDAWGVTIRVDLHGMPVGETAAKLDDAFHRLREQGCIVVSNNTGYQVDARYRTFLEAQHIIESFAGGLRRFEVSHQPNALESLGEMRKQRALQYQATPRLRHEHAQRAPTCGRCRKQPCRAAPWPGAKPGERDVVCEACNAHYGGEVA